MEEQAKTPKPLTFRFIFGIVAAILVLGISVYAYYWYQSTQKTIKLAQEVINTAQKYETLTQYINDEVSRCQKYISQEQGEFAQFEYCKRFINFVNQKPE